jgi:hypothetical protein
MGCGQSAMFPSLTSGGWDSCGKRQGRSFHTLLRGDGTLELWRVRFIDKSQRLSKKKHAPGSIVMRH